MVSTLSGLAYPLVEEEGASKPVLREIAIGLLKQGKFQPRQSFPQESLETLAETIRRMGVLEPLVVRPLGQTGSYEIIAGERRWRAAQLARLSTVPCLISHYTDLQASQIALIENTAREQLNPVDEALAISKLCAQQNYTHEEIAAMIGRTRSYVSNLLRLLKLDERVQRLLQAGTLSEAHGKLLAGLAKTHQYAMALQCIKGEWTKRRLEIEVKKCSAFKMSSHSANATQRHLFHLEQALGDHLNYPVKIALVAEKSGEVKIAFNDFDQLQGILQKLGYVENDAPAFIDAG